MTSTVSSTYAFLVDTYRTETLKTLSVWAHLSAEHWQRRPAFGDPRGRTPLEQCMHQCLSEDTWFRTMLGIDVWEPALPAGQTAADFIQHYARCAAVRADALASRGDDWWSTTTAFFEVPRSRGWILVRRLNHSAHHRGQLTAMLRAWGVALYSTYGPTADTGGLAPAGGQTRYAFADEQTLLAHVAQGSPLPGMPETSARKLTETAD